MHYYVVNMSNGLCGCDEDFIIKNESELTWDDFVEHYTYRDGICGDMDDYDYDEDEYLEDINNYSSYEEISKEKFDSLKNKYEEVKW